MQFAKTIVFELIAPEINLAKLFSMQNVVAVGLGKNI